MPAYGLQENTFLGRQGVFRASRLSLVRSLLHIAPVLILIAGFGLSGCKGDGAPFDGCSTRSLGGCPGSDGYPNPYEGQLELLSWTETLRKASLELTGKLPTDAQIQVTEEQGQLGLQASLAEMMRDEAFYVRLKELYNDHFLTDKYLGRENAIGLLDEEVFPNLRWYESFGQGEQAAELTNDSIAREPLELIAYVVRHDRPFTEILTAKYTVGNGYSAPSYIGLQDVPLRITEDPDRFRRMTVPGVPHAGILTSPMFLNRFPTSDTNRNRHRARMAYKFFLDIDINRFGNRPVDVNEVAGDNPTLTDPNCTICHTTMDPVAGVFKNWDERGIYEARDEWYEDMLEPGFAGQTLPTQRFDNALQWFGEQLSKHPRFALATAHTLFKGLTGQAPLDLTLLQSPADVDPEDDGGVSDGGVSDGGITDGGVPDGGESDGGVADGGAADGGAPDPDPPAEEVHPALERAYQLQKSILEIMRDRFIASGYNLKILVQEVILSPYYRAKDSMPLSPDMALELSAFGTARFLTPEHLSRKIAATTGVHWRRRVGEDDYLLNQYLFFYGGIDSDQVTQRVTEPNGVMASLSQRMAYEVACSAVPYDFSKPTRDRLLFPAIETDTLPLQQQELARNTIRHLHDRLLGEAATEEEVTETFDLLLEVWNLGQQGLVDESVSDQLSQPCRLYQDRNTGDDLPQSRYVDRDPNYTIRAWMAVVSYMLSDYRFVYDQ